MLTILAYVIGAAAEFPGVEGLLFVLLLGPVQLHCLICMWRLYRIRRKEGKKTPLPGYWEHGTELWEPMASHDRLWVVVFCCAIPPSCLMLIALDRLDPAMLAMILPLSGLSAISYVLACYGNPKRDKA